MASIVEICSNALRKIGVAPITSLNDDSDAARLCNALWPEQRDTVLRDHPWNFAQRRAVLALLATAPVWKYANAFQLPNDPYCLRVIETSIDEYDIEWRIEGRTFVTDAAAPVYIQYTARLEDPGDYDASFVDALEQRMAAEMAYPLTGREEMAKTMFALYQAKINMAKLNDSSESSPRSFRADDLIVVRR